MQKPYLGQRVLFYPNGLKGRLIAVDDTRPFLAFVTYVRSPIVVNLIVFDHIGGSCSMGSIEFVANGRRPSSNQLHYCTPVEQEPVMAESV